MAFLQMFSDHAHNNRGNGELIGETNHDQKFRHDGSRQDEPGERGEHHPSNAARRCRIHYTKPGSCQIFHKGNAAGEFEKPGPETALHNPRVPHKYRGQMNSSGFCKHMFLVSGSRARD